MAPLYLNLGADQSELPQLTRMVEQFTDVFESQGGIVLTPDEFVASLNPEYMINLGSALLGDNNPDIVQARQQLDNGKYLASLFTVRAALLPISSVEDIDYGPDDYILFQNYPNPFNSETIINYKLRISNYLNLSIYNLLGQKVATLVNKKQPAGNYSVKWDARDFASGVYFYRLETGTGFVKSRKLVLLK